MFAEDVPFYGYLAINGDDVNIKKISKKYPRAQVKFGDQKLSLSDN